MEGTPCFEDQQECVGTVQTLTILMDLLPFLWPKALTFVTVSLFLSNSMLSYSNVPLLVLLCSSISGSGRGIVRLELGLVRDGILDK